LPFVEGREAFRRGAQQEACEQESVGQLLSRRPVGQEAAGRGGHRARQLGNAAAPAHAAGQLHILEQRPVGEAADGREEVAPDGHGLIAESRQPRLETRAPGIGAEQPVALIEGDPEAGHAEAGVAKGGLEDRSGILGQVRVVVQEHQQFARGHAGPAVALGSTTARRPDQSPARRQWRRLRERTQVVRLAENELRAGKTRGRSSAALAQRRAQAPGRDDDGNWPHWEAMSKFGG